MSRMSDSAPRSPWAFFLPVAAAVLVGVLAADLVRLWYVSRATTAALATMRADLRRQSNAMAAPTATVRVGPAVPSVDTLQGPIGAVRSGASAACVAGYVASRVKGGWDQETPLRLCRATTP